MTTIERDFFEFTATLERLENEGALSDEDYALTEEASANLSEALSEFNSSQTRTNELAMLTAYIELYTIVTDLEDTSENSGN